MSFRRTETGSLQRLLHHSATQRADVTRTISRLLIGDALNSGRGRSPGMTWGACTEVRPLRRQSRQAIPSSARPYARAAVHTPRRGTRCAMRSGIPVLVVFVLSASAPGAFGHTLDMRAIEEIMKATTGGQSYPAGCERLSDHVIECTEAFEGESSGGSSEERYLLRGRRLLFDRDAGGRRFRYRPFAASTGFAWSRTASSEDDALEIEFSTRNGGFHPAAITNAGRSLAVRCRNGQRTRKRLSVGRVRFGRNGTFSSTGARTDGGSVTTSSIAGRLTGLRLHGWHRVRYRNSENGRSCDSGRRTFAVRLSVAFPRFIATPMPPGPSSAGALTRLRRPAGCLGATPDKDCSSPRGLLNSYADSVISPDGRHVYVFSSAERRYAVPKADGSGSEPASETVAEGLSVFGRNQRTGALRQLAGAAGCVLSRPQRGCGTAPLGEVPAWMTMTSDGRDAYVSYSSRLALSRRNRRTGALRAAQGPDTCVAPRAFQGCRQARMLEHVDASVISPDGRTLVVDSWRDDPTRASAIAIFRRNPRTGGIRQVPGGAGCLANLALVGCADLPGDTLQVLFGADGRSMFMIRGGAVLAFRRDGRTGGLLRVSGKAGCASGRVGAGCARARGVSSPSALAASPDGRSLYVISDYTLTVFAIDARTGGIRQLPGSQGCIAGDEPERPPGCAGLGMGFEPTSLAVSPDSRNVYVGSNTSNSGSVVAFARDGRTSSLRPLPGRARCAGLRNDDCGTPLAHIPAYDGQLLVASDGRTLYVTGDEGHGISILRRNPATGALAPLPARFSCIGGRTRDTCPGERPLGFSASHWLTLSPDARHAYVVSQRSTCPSDECRVERQHLEIGIFRRL